jgi:predicted TIM-barrel fold metal-dependent hydrolase
MFGTDWPLANLEDYIAFTKAIVPEEHWEDVFWKNAARIYQIGPLP